ncbi:hypothetical protein Q5425_22510 [Amycolatopsis sp. A133]|uniref:hypothetical protein n=1 Tax=Amycolatopsis sp. A133 TaxID=3064472 RepID=UPI0027F7531A|nr:hypothetical protein [Amycolatopsis sp. A133]MDQ7806520.1 hypothetical protein [Amycolatopsis sp. A133]
MNGTVSIKLAAMAAAVAMAPVAPAEATRACAEPSCSTLLAQARVPASIKVLGVVAGKTKTHTVFVITATTRSFEACQVPAP